MVILAAAGWPELHLYLRIVIFFEELRGLILRLASEVPPRRAPSPSECRFCDITREDCPDRMAGG